MLHVMQGKITAENAAMLAEREKRLQYSAVYTSVVEWLNTAETAIQEDYSGVDYEVVDQKLSLHKVCVVSV